MKGEVPSRPVWLGGASPDNVLQNYVIVEVQPLDCKNTVEHDLVALDRRCGETTDLSQINKIGYFLDYGVGNGVPVVLAPSPVPLPLVLIV
ncbi:hypothetical protein E2C01_046511 [Portunus trituberculatus]|uniref:Uncharacterized protein n=1 Tax=Portunus trituberculatus TaxID=210409 RepID=A0A5B7G517_PORTR|nr:hypothetical protein [Portunus trituberculatus]